ncbi:MAG: glycosyltransferase family 2 protein [bacterium]|nr:glycosyltransferase family 2 protein [bacterium]
MTNKKLSIIIPAWNEEKTVGKVIEKVLAAPFPVGWQKEVIAVNDGSSDGTKAVIDSFSTRIKAVHMSKNGGKGSAVKEGLKKASGDFAVIQDADLECDPAEIALLLEALQKSPQEKTAVMGSREMFYGNQKDWSLSRLGSLSITTLINFLYGSSFSDALMCYKLFPRRTFGYFQGGGFDSEMIFLVNLLKDGYKVIEVPVTYNPRDKGQGKKISYIHGVQIIFKILRLWISHKFGKKNE